MIYGLVGRSLWSDGTNAALGVSQPFYGAYPLLVGLPLHLGGTINGVTAIQAMQAVVVSLTAAVVWAWSRPSAGTGWALVAATLTLCLPALAYSGFLMTEAVFLPAGVFVLWFSARVLTEPTLSRQLTLVVLFVLIASVRIQGVVFVPAFVGAALLAAWFARDRGLLRRLRPIWATLGVGGAVLVLLQILSQRSTADGLGAYAGTLTSDYDAGEAARWVVRHAGDVFLLVLGVPLVALGALGYGAARGREGDAAVRALVAVTISAVVFLTLQVGVFASRFVGQLAERDLIVTAPPLFACLAVWLARRLPRPQPATAIIATIVAVPAVLLPVERLVTTAAVPDAFMTVPLARLAAATSTHAMGTVWPVFVAGMVLLAVFIPARLRAVIPILIGACLIVSCVLVNRELERRTSADRTSFFGDAAPSWVDDAARESVTYFHDGGEFWPAVWATAFWNERINRVVRLRGPTPGPVPGSVVTLRPDGSVVDAAGRPALGNEVVVATPVTLNGAAVASVTQVNLDRAGLRLWRSDRPLRVSTWTYGLEPNGDIVRDVLVRVYACEPGSLELTLLGKDGAPVQIWRNGRLMARLVVPPTAVRNASIPAPATANRATVCTFRIRSAGLVGSTRIEFVRS